MSEYINRAALIERIEYYINHTPKSSGEHYAYSVVFKEVLNRPAADVAPVVHGRWEPTEAPFMSECEDCSACGYRTVWGHRFNYCPNCGAKMDGGADNENSNNM